jgi:hypothetical protein
MVVTAKTPRGGTPPRRIEPDQPKDNGQSANNAQSRKKCKGALRDTCSANDDGKTTTKSRKRSSDEGDNNEDEAAGAKGAPGGHKRSTASNGRKASNTQGAGTKNNVNSATPSPDGDAEGTTNRELKMQIPTNREQMRSPKKLQEVMNAALLNHH